jgi:hypothetical protein
MGALVPTEGPTQANGPAKTSMGKDKGGLGHTSGSCQSLDRVGQRNSLVTLKFTAPEEAAAALQWLWPLPPHWHQPAPQSRYSVEAMTQ